MPSDAAKLKALLHSVGYTGQVSERRIAASFEGREDVLHFLSTELSKENYVSPDKARRLEELKHKEAIRLQGGLEESDSGDETDEEPMGLWEKAEGVLEIEETAQSLQKRAQEDMDVCSRYHKKKKQLESLENRLRSRIKFSTERVEAHIEGSTVLEEQLTCAQEEVERKCIQFEGLQQQYVDVLENFKDVLLNSCGEWFFPQVDTEKLWNHALGSEAEIERLQSLMCSKPATHPPTANLFVPSERAGHSSARKSLTNILLEESQFEKLPWLKELQGIQLSRLLLLKDRINAKRKLNWSKARLALWTESEKMLSRGDKVLSEAQDSACVEAEIESLVRDRDDVLQDYPSLCASTVQCSTDEVIAQQVRHHAEKWQELNESKRKLLSHLTYQVATYRAIEFLSHQDGQMLKANLPDINYVHDQLLQLGKGQSTRQKLYMENTTQNAKSFARVSDTHISLLTRIVRPGLEALHHFDKQDDGAPGVLATFNTVEGTPITRLQDPSPVFSPQPSSATTPGAFTDELSPLPVTPISSWHGESAGPSVQELCNNMDNILKLLAFLVKSTDKFVQSSSEGIVEKNMRMTEEVGKLYALIFNERNSKEPTISTNTIVDNFVGTENLTKTIETDRVAIADAFMRMKTAIRMDLGKSEHRTMMCTFFSDPNAFFSIYVKKMREAERHKRP